MRSLFRPSIEHHIGNIHTYKEVRVYVQGDFFFMGFFSPLLFRCITSDTFLVKLKATIQPYYYEICNYFVYCFYLRDFSSVYIFFLRKLYNDITFIKI